MAIAPRVSPLEILCAISPSRGSAFAVLFAVHADACADFADFTMWSFWPILMLWFLRLFIDINCATVIEFLWAMRDSESPFLTV